MNLMPNIFESFKNASMFPDVDVAMQGLERARYGKEPFKVTDYQVRVFDMGSPSDRDEYCRLMQRLMPLCQDAQCVVTKNELQVLNGSGWWRYVEWFEYKLNDVSLTTRPPSDQYGVRADMDESNDETQEEGDETIW